MKKLLCFWIAAFMLQTAAVHAQGDDGDEDCRLLLNTAKRYYNQGKEKAAMSIFTSIVESCEGNVRDEAERMLKELKMELTEDVEVITVRNVSFNMVKVPGGTFKMGATVEQGSETYSDEKPVHNVTLSDFYMGQTEVTQELWEAVMRESPSYFEGDGKRPVENVSWEDCQRFINRLNSMTGRNFRLPTEAEWEYAARGGNKSGQYKYSGSDHLNAVAWHGENSDEETHPVEKKSPNELGLFDMSGNVYEWCQDWYGKYSKNDLTNPQGPSEGEERILRGGCWNSKRHFMHLSYRYSTKPDNRIINAGMRLVLPAY